MTLPAIDVSERALARSKDLTPYVDTIEAMVPDITSLEELVQLDEATAAVAAVAAKRGVRPLMMRIEKCATRIRWWYGRLTPDGRKGRSGKTSQENDVLPGADRNERAANKKLASAAPDLPTLDDAMDAVEEEEALPTRGRVIEFLTRGKLRREAEKGGGVIEWYTPANLIAIARDVMGGIDLDPASCEKAQRTVQADAYYDADDDGLAREWPGRIWLNPPYVGKLIRAFAAKAVEEFDAGRMTQMVWISPTNATATAWSQHLQRRATGLCLIRGRVKFIDASGSEVPNAWDSMLLYMGEDTDNFVGVCNAHEVGMTWKKEAE